MQQLTRLLGAGIVLVQLADVLLHIRIDQAEPIRIVSNVIVIAWVVALFLGLLAQQIRSVMLGATGIYLLLNLIFLMQNGLTNAELGGSPRIGLIIFVLVTLVLSGLLIGRLRGEA